MTLAHSVQAQRERNEKIKEIVEYVSFGDIKGKPYPISKLNESSNVLTFVLFGREKSC